MYFGTKSYLKSTHNHTVKHALNRYKSCLNQRPKVSMYLSLSLSQLPNIRRQVNVQSVIEDNIY
jgi:hypothetical protein